MVGVTGVDGTILYNYLKIESSDKTIAFDKTSES